VIVTLSRSDSVVRREQVLMGLNGGFPKAAVTLAMKYYYYFANI
jgi:hypothetical protein